MLSLDQENLINEIKILLSQYLNYYSVDDFSRNRCHQSGNEHRLNEFANVLKNLLINSDCLYLHAVVYHQGSTLQSGHFLAEIYVNSAWYKVSDESVEQIGLYSNILMLSLDQKNLINEIKLLLSQYLNYY